MNFAVHSVKQNGSRLDSGSCTSQLGLSDSPFFLALGTSLVRSLLIFLRSCAVLCLLEFGSQGLMHAQEQILLF